jgi:hypothetical protein
MTGFGQAGQLDWHQTVQTAAQETDGCVGRRHLGGGILTLLRQAVAPEATKRHQIFDQRWHRSHGSGGHPIVNLAITGIVTGLLSSGVNDGYIAQFQYIHHVTQEVGFLARGLQ